MMNDEYFVMMNDGYPGATLIRVFVATFSKQYDE